MDFELKKTYSDRDPKVQLAIWKAGGLKKMRYHNWDMSMPMPGVTVDGSEWRCYLFFARDSDLVSARSIYQRTAFLLKPVHAKSNYNHQVMMGSLSMGSTETVRGTFEILYKLYILMRWGKTDYEAWFKKYVLTWCQNRAAGTIAVGARLTSLQL